MDEPSGTRSGTSAMAQLDTYAERVRVQLPAAPDNVLDIYVKWAPWVIMVFGALAVIALLGLLGMTSVLLPLFTAFGGYRYGSSILSELVFSLLLAGLDIAGGYMMLKRRITGWWLVAAGLVVYAILDLFSAAVLGLIVTVLVAYLHLQVKPRYS
jgi:hypothetical protein